MTELSIKEERLKKINTEITRLETEQIAIKILN